MSGNKVSEEIEESLGELELFYILKQVKRIPEMNISQIKINPNNPRFIKDEKFKKLVKSIKEFPRMMELRPIILDDDNMILAGNMRMKALEHLKYKEIPDNWIKKASELTKEEKRKFIVLDNVSFGEWDFDILSSEFEIEELKDMGFDDFELGIANEKEVLDEKTLKNDGITNKFQLILNFKNETELKLEYEKHKQEGYECQVFML